MHTGTNSPRGALLPLLSMLLGAWSGMAIAQSDEMCLPSLSGLTGLPAIADGVVEGDNGWAKATQHNLNAGRGAFRTAVLYTGTSSTDVYVGLVVDEPTPGVDNTLVMTLSTDGNCAHDWKIHIKPWDTAVVDGPSQVPHIVSYWRDSCAGAWNAAAPTAAGAGFWLKDNTRVSKDGSRWSLEMQIPRESNVANAGSDAKVYFPSTGGFPFYVNVLSTSVILGTVNQAPWPSDGEITGPGLLEQLTPSVAAWGTASLNQRPECTGLSLAWNDVGTTNVPQHQMKIAPPPYPAQCTDTVGPSGPNNTFFANVNNDTGASAPGVSVVFKLANWGIPGPGDWAPIGPAGVADQNPTAAQTVPAAGQTFNMNWAPTCAQSQAYSTRTHQCILVEMDSEQASVRFKNRGVTRNMDFVTASRFERAAAISAKGYGSPPAGRGQHEFILSINTQVQAYTAEGKHYVPQDIESIEGENAPLTHAAPASSRLLPSRIAAQLYPEGLSEALIWQANGYLKSGNTIVINGRDYEDAKYVGGFGYFVGHSGAVKGWNFDVSGDGVRRVQEAEGAVYQVDVPQDGAVELVTWVEAEETGPCECFDLACWFQRIKQWLGL